ncbi:snare associated Golgi protein-domain-containing protein [Chlamydoabsidia padenii]|nr:snare associated Golgi protein-domain-containing protein [Chlamydoabsidia padenii]
MVGGDTRLNSIKDPQGKISLNGTSHLSATDYEGTEGAQLDIGKSSTEFEDDDDDRVGLLASNDTQPPTISSPPQERWWQEATILDNNNNNDTPTSWKVKGQRLVWQWTQHIRQLDRRQIMEYAVQYRWVLLFFGFSFLMGAVMWAWRKELLTALETLSNTVREMGPSGYLLIAFLIFLSAFPPMIGYGTFQSLSGFTFGFAKGFPISYFSALFGAIACFVISRRFLKKRVLHTMAKYPNLEAVVKAVEKKGFKLFVLIRFSPYPFNLLNVLFASTEIPLSQFALGTAISLIKIGLHVYIGANLTSFAKHVLGEEDDLTESEKRAETIREIAVVIGSLLATGVMIYVYFVAKKAVEDVRQENEESMAFLGGNNNNPGGGDEENRMAMEEAGVSDDWVEWNESDEDEGGVNNNNNNNNIKVVPL